jgi:hypothetical protein
MDDASSEIARGLPPIAVGGVGGSGTRVVARILDAAGFFIGDDVNNSLDNLWFTLLFKHEGILSASNATFDQLSAIFQAAMTGDGRVASASDRALIEKLAAEDRPQQHSPWLRQRARTLLPAIAAVRKPKAWAWKEPNTHMVVDRLAANMSILKYIHVARNGLDMAVSNNQNQLRLWGPHVLDLDEFESPRASLRFWCWAHRRILRIGRDLGQRFLFIKFDDLCQDPRGGVETLLSFCGLGLDVALRDRLAELIKPPATIARHKDLSFDLFDADDVAFVREIGFDISK